MAKFHGTKAVFKIDDSGGTLRDISPHVDDVTFSQKLDTVDVTGEGQSSAPVKSVIVGFTDATISLKGSWDNTANTGSETVLGGVANNGGQLAAGGTLSWEYNPAGTGTGTIKYSGEGYLTQYDQSSPVGGRVGFSATIAITGAITRTTN